VAAGEVLEVLEVLGLQEVLVERLGPRRRSKWKKSSFVVSSYYMCFIVGSHF
jgi:hypothetical protein